MRRLYRKIIIGKFRNNGKCVEVRALNFYAKVITEVRCAILHETIKRAIVEGHRRNGNAERNKDFFHDIKSSIHQFVGLQAISFYRLPYSSIKYPLQFHHRNIAFRPLLCIPSFPNRQSVLSLLCYASIRLNHSRHGLFAFFVQIRAI